MQLESLKSYLAVVRCCLAILVPLPAKHHFEALTSCFNSYSFREAGPKNDVCLAIVANEFSKKRFLRTAGESTDMLGMM